MISRMSFLARLENQYVSRYCQPALCPSTFLYIYAYIYAKISVTTPEPTVLPPSRTANRNP
jgi:hypothetical protein